MEGGRSAWCSRLCVQTLLCWHWDLMKERCKQRDTAGADEALGIGQCGSAIVIGRVSARQRGLALAKSSFPRTQEPRQPQYNQLGRRASLQAQRRGEQSACETAPQPCAARTGGNRAECGIAALHKGIDAVLDDGHSAASFAHRLAA